MKTTTPSSNMADITEKPRMYLELSLLGSRYKPYICTR